MLQARERARAATAGWRVDRVRTPERSEHNGTLHPHPMVGRERVPFFRMPLWVRTVLIVGELLFLATWAVRIPFVAAALPSWLTTSDLLSALQGLFAAALILGYWYNPTPAPSIRTVVNVSTRRGRAGALLLVGAALLFGLPLLGLFGLLGAALVPGLGWLGVWAGGVATLSSILNLLLLITFWSARDAIRRRVRLSQQADPAP